MELKIVKNGLERPQENTETVKVSKFIESNTQPISLAEIEQSHTIPVFVKDNTPSISQVEFINFATQVAASTLGLRPTKPAIRVSHPIKGRIFEARHKKVNELLDSEKTIYYERMAFIIDFPQVKKVVNGQEVSLSLVGVKAYNLDNLYAYGRSKQSFKVAIGWKVGVCTNMCIWTDGTLLDIKARDIEELCMAIQEMLHSFDRDAQLEQLKRLGDYNMSEQQFAHLLGKSRMYHYLPQRVKKSLPQLLLPDTHVSMVTKSYYQDKHFKRNEDGSINLWNLYNLFTNAVKGSYVDTFLDRNVNAFTFCNGLTQALDNKRSEYQWFLG